MELNLFNAVYEAKAKLDKKSNICKKYQVTRNALDWGLGTFLRETSERKDIRHQMLLGSILGDGYFQVAKGKYYKYRETHCIEQLEYARWKYLMLLSWTNNTKIVPKGDKAVELYTSSHYGNMIKPYCEMSKDEAIEQLNIYGLLFYLLDNGWYSQHSKDGNFCIGSKILERYQKEAIIKVFNNYSIECSLIGKADTISINSKYNKVLLSYLDTIAPTLDIDVIKSKFGNISMV